MSYLTFLCPCPRNSINIAATTIAVNYLTNPVCTTLTNSYVPFILPTSHSPYCSSLTIFSPPKCSLKLVSCIWHIVEIPFQATWFVTSRNTEMQVGFFIQLLFLSLLFQPSQSHSLMHKTK